MNNKQRLFSPTLMILICLLLVILLYIKFIFLPINEKLETVLVQNTSLANELDFFNSSIPQVEKIQAELKEAEQNLAKTKEIEFLKADQVSDDLNVAIEKTAVKEVNLKVGQPNPASLPNEDDQLMGYTQIPVQISFSATPDQAIQLLSYFEEASKGAYVIEEFSGKKFQGLDNYNYSLTMSLFIKDFFDGAI